MLHELLIHKHFFIQIEFLKSVLGFGTKLTSATSADQDLLTQPSN
jgi:hypothetical protein